MKTFSAVHDYTHAVWDMYAPTLRFSSRKKSSGFSYYSYQSSQSRRSSGRSSEKNKESQKAVALIGAIIMSVAAIFKYFSITNRCYRLMNLKSKQKTAIHALEQSPHSIHNKILQRSVQNLAWYDNALKTFERRRVQLEWITLNICLFSAGAFLKGFYHASKSSASFSPEAQSCINLGIATAATAALVEFATIYFYQQNSSRIYLHSRLAGAYVNTRIQSSLIATVFYGAIDTFFSLLRSIAHISKSTLRFE